jgi:hypothetical protein
LQIKKVNDLITPKEEQLANIIDQIVEKERIFQNANNYHEPSNTKNPFSDLENFSQK